MCRITYQKMLSSKQSTKSKSTFRVDYMWIRGEDGTQSLSFQIMKCVDYCGEHHIKKFVEKNNILRPKNIKIYL